MPEEFSFSVDSDWKKQAQEEKRKLAEEAAAKPPATPAVTAKPAASTGSAAPSGPPAARRRRARDELPEASFTTLVQTLASQALLYMGAVPTAGGEGVVDLDTAKFQIDLLAALEDKTQGNLSAEERSALDVTLYETRMRFVGVASRYIL